MKVSVFLPGFTALASHPLKLSTGEEKMGYRESRLQSDQALLGCAAESGSPQSISGHYFLMVKRNRIAFTVMHDPYEN